MEAATIENSSGMRERIKSMDAPASPDCRIDYGMRDRVGTGTIWELHSLSNEPARCSYQCSHLIPHLITVTVGDTELLHEQFETEAEAVLEASYLFDDYLLRGWTDLIYRDPRLADSLA
jgi:hypothetical protein